MNISYNWLKKYINIDKSVDELSTVLTSIGLEVGGVESVQTIKGGLEGLVIGKVITCTEHENSDHLHVTTVDVGEEELLQIVCGAPNVAAGQTVVVATIGTTLYSGDEEFKIKKSKIRGVTSCGMICAEDEIGVGESHNGIIVLPDSVPAGTLAKDYYKVESDTVIEVDITPNRADAVSHYGVARDLAAYYALQDSEVRAVLPAVDSFAVENENLTIPVEVEDENAAPRYATLTLSDVNVTESPDWLKNALTTIGVRSVNNIVDVTNYVLFELGQPLHAFDADKITNGVVRVKTLPKDTPFTTLDGVERKLSDKDLMICNGDEPMCIAGVFGGENSGVSSNTKNVLLESAYFNPVSVRKTARFHGLNTDASFRFERGIDPNITIYALQRAAMLIKEVAGGTISSNISDHYPTPIAPFEVNLKKSKISSLIGKEIEENVIKQIFKGLEMKIVSETNDSYLLQVPPYRVDVKRDVDVIEDILRIYGYNNIENNDKLLSTLSYTQAPDSHRLQLIVSEQLTAQGFHEVLNNSLTKEKYYAENELFLAENSVKIINPLSNDLSLMRQTLLFGGMENIARNINHRNSDLMLYEFGNCYFFNAGRKNSNETLAPYSEEYHLALWLTGNQYSDSWISGTKPTSIFQLKAILLNILKRVGVEMENIAMENFENQMISQGATITTKNGVEIAQFGIVSPKACKMIDIDQELYYADVNWTKLLTQLSGKNVNFSELPKYPEVKRDFAFLLDKNIEFADIEKAAFNAEKNLLKRVALFDVYEGKNLENGKKSYAVSFILQDENRTLTDKVIEKTMAKIEKEIETKLGAKLR